MAANEPVEIKVTVAGSVPGAISALDLGNPSIRRSIWFLEDRTPGLPSALPLLDAGVILRLRQEHGGTDDSTVKLRPCRRSQLTRAWRREAEGPQWTYRIEEDWAGRRRALGASCVADLEEGLLSAAAERQTGWAVLLHGRQEQFLADCADLRVDVDGLVALGPIAAVRWKKFDLGEYEVVAERWTVKDLDFLELSIREDEGAAQAAATQAGFEAALREREVPIPDELETKTRTVLERLAETRPAGPAEAEE
jgi:hypothetical protein